MVKKSLLYGLLACFAMQSLSFDSGLVQLEKQKAQAILSRHEYMGGLYTVLLAGAFYTGWNCIPTVLGKMSDGPKKEKVETKTWFDWAYKQGEGLADFGQSIGYSLIKGQITGFLGGYATLVWSNAPFIKSMKNDVAASFQPASMQWFLDYQTDFNTHIKQAMALGVQLDMYAPLLIDKEKYTKHKDTMLFALDETIATQRHLSNQGNKNTVSHEIFVAQAKGWLAKVKADCLFLTGAMHAMHDRGQLSMGQRLMDMHEKKLKEVLDSCNAFLDAPEKEQAELSKQGQGIFSKLYMLRNYMLLVFA